MRILLALLSCRSLPPHCSKHSISSTCSLPGLQSWAVGMPVPERPVSSRLSLGPREHFPELEPRNSALEEGLLGGFSSIYREGMWPWLTFFLCHSISQMSEVQTEQTGTQVLPPNPAFFHLPKVLCGCMGLLGLGTMSTRKEAFLARLSGHPWERAGCQAAARPVLASLLSRHPFKGSSSGHLLF